VILKGGGETGLEKKVGVFKIMHVSIWLKQGIAQAHPAHQSQGWWMLRLSA